MKMMTSWRWLAAAIIAGTLVSQPLAAQSEAEELRRYNEVEQGALPTGRLQNIDWKRGELQIDGKRYAFDKRLRVFNQTSEIALFDLVDNALIRYQTAKRGESEVIVAIWTANAGSVIPS
ncbi:MAG: hypothetical protein Tsb002_23790 [Wenzhouxiangellaceae bacterium]